MAALTRLVATNTRKKRQPRRFRPMGEICEIMTFMAPAQALARCHAEVGRCPLHSQLDAVLNDVPMARVFIGKTSDWYTHDTGPYEKANAALNRKMKAMPATPALLPTPCFPPPNMEPIPASIARKIAIASAPQMRGLRRPRRSMINVMKTQLVVTFHTPLIPLIRRIVFPLYPRLA